MSGGILGQGAPQGAGILGGFNQFANDNSAALLGLGAGLLSGDWGSGAQGFAQGMAQDERTRLLKMKEAEDERRKVAAQQLAQKLGKPELAEFPELAGQLYVAMNKPKDPQLIGSAETGYTWATPGAPLPDNIAQGTGPKTNWEIKTIKNSDGSETPVYFNPRTMETKPVPGYGTGSSKAAAAEAQTRQAADIVVQDIDRALDITGKSDVTLFGFDTGINKVTGAAGQALSNVGGTQANDVAKLTDTIKANATFDKLQAMRKSSPTGAALGAVSDTENKLLGAAIGSLEQSQTKEQFVRNLQRVKKIYNEIIHGPGTTDEAGNLRSAQGAVSRNQDGSISTPYGTLRPRTPRG